MAENHTTTIQISSIEVNKGRYKIGTTAGESYSFFDNWQGRITIPMETFNNLGVVVGTVVDIIYTETANVNQNTGRPIVYKNIQRFIASPGAVPVGGVAPPAPQGNGGVRTIGTAVRTLQVDEARHDSEVIGKMVFGFIQSEIQAGRVTIKQANTGPYVAEAVMLAERVQHQCRPNRGKSNLESETELTDMPFEPWEEEQNAQR